MENNLYKFITSSVIAGAVIYFERVAIPVIVLICFMVLDYITGITVAWINKELSSRIGIIGIIKKVFYLIMIGVGMGADYIITRGFAEIGISVDYTYAVSMIITIWLIINELISIMENVAKVEGKTIPPFIKKLLERLKNVIEEKTE